MIKLKSIKKDMKNKIYVVKYTTGSIYEKFFITVFASTNKRKAEKWVERFNTKLKYWQDYYSRFSDHNNREMLDFKYIGDSRTHRFWQIMECDEAFIGEIEKR